MAEIAEILGVTRQRVAQLVETYDDFPAPEVELSGGRVWSRTAVETWIASHPERGPGRPEESKERRFFGRKSGEMFDRFTDLARQSIVRAQEEARLMSHNYIGTEHLLLGLLVIGDGVAWAALSALDVRVSHVRGKILAMIGRGAETPQGHIPFTPRSKKVLQAAMSEAIDLGHNYIGTEHVLLAIANEPDGVGWKALAALGLGTGQVRDAVLDTLRGWQARKLRRPGTVGVIEEAPRGEYVVCSFCGGARPDVDRIVAGPGGYICNECIWTSAEIIGTPRPAPESQPDVMRRLERLEEVIGRLAPDDDAS